MAEGTVSFSFLRHIDASPSEGDFGVRCEDRAAIAGARRTGVVEDQVSILGIATLFDQSAFGRWLQRDAGVARGLQPRVSTRAAGTRSRLDF